MRRPCDAGVAAANRPKYRRRRLRENKESIPIIGEKSQLHLEVFLYRVFKYNCGIKNLNYSQTDHCSENLK